MKSVFNMNEQNFDIIKKKFLRIDSSRYWGDDFDVRFYLISELQKIKNKTIIDIGGGIGIVLSEIDKTNFKINIDTSYEDLKTSNEENNHMVEVVCASMTNLPFKENVFDHAICAHILEIAKKNDLDNENIIMKNDEKYFPTIESTLSEISRIMKNDGTMFLTTPNNLYYKGKKLEYTELKNALKKYFSKISIQLFNTYPRISQKNRKLNLANTIPKIKAKFMDKDRVLKSLLKNDSSKKKWSVAFYVKAS